MDVEPFADSGEQGLSTATIKALSEVTQFGVAEEVFVAYGRWWQLENWLRELAHLELQGRYGSNWVDRVKRAKGWLNKDAEWTHMLGRDNDNPLAYLDFSTLNEVIDADWELFKPVMPRQASWAGQHDDLERVRHRIAHLRYPHRDDLLRIEQTLRDLERGAYIAAASFNDRWRPDSEDEDNPIIRDWIWGQSADAKRLIDHVDANYGVQLDISRSRRPWANRERASDQIGWLWHVEFYARDNDFDLEAIWRDSYFADAKRLCVLLEADSPNCCTLTFSAADNFQAVSDCIGGAFEAVVQNVGRWGRERQPDRAWRHTIRQLGYQVTSRSVWTTVSRSTLPISIFGTGGRNYKPAGLVASNQGEATCHLPTAVAPGCACAI